MAPRLLVVSAIVTFLHSGIVSADRFSRRPDVAPWADGTSQIATFSARVETVRLDVSVRQGANVVRGLVASDFEVLDNGVRQEIDLLRLEETPVSVVLALDMSGSVQGGRLNQLREAGTLLASRLQPGDRAALLVFADLVTIRSDFTTDRASLLSALQQPAIGINTALVDAAHAAMVMGDSRSGRPLVLIFSDGTDTASFLSPDLVRDTARRNGSSGLRRHIGTRGP
jgi:VWFA-related protein